MHLVLVAALARNRAIGRQGRLPWHYPADMRHFRHLTWGHPVVMGRRTFEGLGRPLPGRTNLVLSRDPSYQPPPGVLVFASLEAARAHCQALGAERLFVIGGAQVYAQALPQADGMVLTHLPDEVEGDAFFPAWSPDEWEIVDRREQEGLCFVTYKRRGVGNRE